MKKQMFLPVVGICLILGQAHAAPFREIFGEELRTFAAREQAIPFSRLLAKVRAAIGGELLDVRAFSDGRVYYRVVMIQPDGHLLGVIVDAITGEYVSPQSPIASSIARVVDNGRSPSKASGPAPSVLGDLAQSRNIDSTTSGLTGKLKSGVGSGGGDSGKGSGGQGSSGSGGGLGGGLLD